MLTSSWRPARIRAIVVLAAAPALAACTGADRVGSPPTASSAAAGSTTTTSQLPSARPVGDLDELATGLAVPWSVGFLPD
ncbi:MAG TPA: hypothetical protein VHM65_08675, partial [Candidatus Lustribacter sp.]|nr:hypothetical protein [Candidatus Lustribacter sp.]